MNGVNRPLTRPQKRLVSAGSHGAGGGRAPAATAGALVGPQEAREGWQRPVHCHGPPGLGVTRPHCLQGLPEELSCPKLGPEPPEQGLSPAAPRGFGLASSGGRREAR